jgi:tRNA(Arg) A34 adenosine deaminase TadA
MSDDNNSDQQFLRRALEKAKESLAQGGFPAGAVIVIDAKVVGEGTSIGNKINDPTSHGDMAAIRNACFHLKKTDLSGATLYTSMQPCLMCFGAAMWGSIAKIVFACAKEKVSVEYYGGHYHCDAINADLIRPIKIVHDVSLENESRALIQDWERLLKQPTEKS